MRPGVMRRGGRIGDPLARALGCVVIALALGACSPEAPPIAVKLRPAMPSAREMLAQVRAAGAANPEALEVRPLRDPQVGDLRDRALALDAQADFAGAAQAIAQALAIAPADPELLQLAAEFALAREDWANAATFSRRSWEGGAKAGSLCRRNWATLRFVQQATGDPAGVQDATAKLATCNIEPPLRM